MGRSQRHMLLEQNTTATGEVHAEGAVAPYVTMAGASGRSEGEEFVPVGPPGGPLQGSTLGGVIPDEAISEPPPEENPPTITAVAPATAVAAAPDTAVTVTGTNFGEDVAVLFGGAAVPTVWVDATSATATLPTSTAVAGVVPVAVSSGGLTATTPVDFTITAAARTGAPPAGNDPLSVPAQLKDQSSHLPKAENDLRKKR